LETQKIQQGKKFKLKLAEDLTTPSGLVIPRGRRSRRISATFNRGYRAQILMSFDEIETKHGGCSCYAPTPHTAAVSTARFVPPPRRVISPHSQ